MTAKWNEQTLAAQHPGLDSLLQVAIDLEVTSVCDAVCGFCPRDVMPDKKRFISMALVDRLAEDLRKQKMFLVVLCGIGESTLHPQLNQIVRTIADTGTKVEMTTHGGRRLNTRRFEELIEHGLTGFHFSLNAMTAETHRRVMKLKDFDKTLANLEEILALREARYPHVALHVSFVVCDANEHEVGAFVDYWRVRPVTQVWLHPLNNRAGLLSPGVKAVDIEPYAEAYEFDEKVLVDVFGELYEHDRLCKIAHRMIFISADGDMRLCAMDYRRVTSYGNLLKDSLPDMHRRKILTYMNGQLDGFCSNCSFCPPGLRTKEETIDVGA